MKVVYYQIKKGRKVIINHPNLMCVGVQKPNEWQMGDRNGVTYKVEVSDGSGTLSLPCDSGDTWKLFEPFKPYAVSIELTQVAREGRMGVRARIVNAARNDQK